jgi:hypothetical protein
MKIILLGVIILSTASGMDRMDYERSAQEKSNRYRFFLKAMQIMEQEAMEIDSSLASRREIIQLHIKSYRMIEEPEDFIILSKDDFEGA